MKSKKSTNLGFVFRVLFIFIVFILAFKVAPAAEHVVKVEQSNSSLINNSAERLPNSLMTKNTYLGNSKNQSLFAFENIDNNEIVFSHDGNTKYKIIFFIGYLSVLTILLALVIKKIHQN